MAIAETSPPVTAEIQPFGALIACGPDLGEITHASENIATVLGQTPDGLLGAPLASIAPRDLIHEMRNILSLRHFAEGRHFAGAHDLPMGAWDVSASYSSAGNHVVIEFEPPAGSRQTWEDFAAELRHLSAALRTSGGAETLVTAMVTWLRLATGYDSAAAYRYRPGGGEVMAEAGHTVRQSLMGERLGFLETLPEARPGASHPILHFIADASAGAARILARSDAPDRLDLAHCHLRGASLADIDAASKLGASAVVTLPIVMNSGVWGMVFLHNRRPKTPSRYVRQICEALASVAADRLEILNHSPAARPQAVAPKADISPDLGGKSALVVEGNRLIAADLKLTLMELGFVTVSIFDEEAAALEHLASNPVDLGVLDLHPSGPPTSFEVARKLAELGTPFLFSSRYGAGADLPDGIGPRPVVLKPANRQDLSARIDELLVVGPADPAQNNGVAKGRMR